ncbi:MAG TPA: hypothetical protein VK504_02185 [Vicinamibacterales bacterium]|jgi:Holliday junction resolvase|nr:hypothetical protein [Vicinamibacterales bacterium]
MRVGQSRRRDANEGEIVAALERVGARVTRISGTGAPDLLVRRAGQLFAFEVKTAKGLRTAAQLETEWPIVRSVEEALAAIGVTVSVIRIPYRDMHQRVCTRGTSRAAAGLFAKVR